MTSAVETIPAPITMRVRNTANDHEFTVRLVRPGDKYGLDRCLTNPKGAEALVEFYDATYVDDPRFDLGLGQFVSRYSLTSILDPRIDRQYVGLDMDRVRVGLDLDGGVAEWKVDGAAMNVVYDWLVMWASLENMGLVDL